MKATFNFLTKRTEWCPSEMSSRSPTSPGALFPSEPCQEQLNIRKLFKGLFQISCNPIISHSPMMSSRAPSQAMTMPSVALGRLEVTSHSPAPGTARLVGSMGRGMPRFVPPAVCTSSSLHPLAGSSVLGVKSGATLSAGKGRRHCGVL